MLSFTHTLVSNAAVTDSVAETQTPGAAGALTLTASTVTFASDTAQRITITSASDISNRTFVIVGTTPGGLALTVSGFTGPNATTVTTAVAFKSVTSVTISGAAAGAITVGNSAAAESPMYVTDANSNPFLIGFGVARTSGTYTVQHTYDDVTATSYNYATGTWFDNADIAGETTTLNGSYVAPVRAIRLIMTAAGTCAMSLLQSGGGYR